MKRFSVALVVGMIGLLLFAGSALAMDKAGKMGLGAELGYNAIADSSIPDAPGIDAEFDGSFLLGATGTYFFTDFVSLEMSLGYTETEVEASGYGVSIDMGDVSQIPWLLTARAHYPNASMVSPYLGAGLGYYFNEMDVSGFLIDAAAPKAYSMELDNSFGFHVTGGAEVFFNENTALDLGLQYSWNNADFEEVKGGKVISSGDLDLDAFTATAGLKYYF